MSISTFDLFSIGIGPSSSHTVGPMIAAERFANNVESLSGNNTKIIVELYGSLALTGIGHGTDNAILLGLEGEHPATVDTETINARAAQIKKNHNINLNGKKNIHFNPAEQLIWHQGELLPLHSNGMCFSLIDQQENILLSQIYYSIGGGFIATDVEMMSPPATTHTLPYPFETAKQLFDLCDKHHLTIAQLMMANEKSWQDEQEVNNQCRSIANTMEQCINLGCQTEGILPGGLQVKRRAPKIYQQLKIKDNNNSHHTDVLNWVNVFAIAVNEQNAAGQRIVTAPTNGAAGIIPAVLQYYKQFCEQYKEDGVIDFILTASAIAILYKKQASISGAELGCQGEVGVACSMAAAALTAVQNGSLEQVENGKFHALNEMQWVQ